MATPRQNFALFTATGIDVRNLNLSVEQASGYIALTKEGHVDAVRNSLISAGGVVKREVKPKQNWQELYDKAHAAGCAAAEANVPVPMIVQERASPLNDNSPVTRSWHVSEGVCGFAWITVKPGTSSFARWLVKNDLARSAYEGGVSIWVSSYGQSMERKEAYAHAFAKVLRENGISRAWAGSRMD